MGAKPGSGGSSGQAWLERSAARVVFPDLWAARTEV
jgi:tryptophan 2,3-dioxygenase